MTDRLFLYLSLLILSIVNISFTWPMRNPSVTSTFGESRWDHFHDGIDIVSPGDKVFPVDPGSLVYMWDKSLFPLDNYPGVGNYKIIKHAGGKFSFYMHLEDGVSLKRIYAGEDYLGIIGNSGRSMGKHLHFSLIDMKSNTSINPFLELPALKDDNKPKIGEIFMKIGEKVVMIRNNSAIRLTQHYPVLVKIEDSIKGQERLGIYKFSSFINGKKVIDMVFDKNILSDKGFLINGTGYEGIFDGRGLYKINGIKYIQGINEIKVIASDFSGNEAEKIFVLNVNLELNQ